MVDIRLQKNLANRLQSDWKFNICSFPQRHQKTKRKVLRIVVGNQPLRLDLMMLTLSNFRAIVTKHRQLFTSISTRYSNFYLHFGLLETPSKAHHVLPHAIKSDTLTEIQTSFFETFLRKKNYLKNGREEKFEAPFELVFSNYNRYKLRIFKIFEI